MFCRLPESAGRRQSLPVNRLCDVQAEICAALNPFYEKHFEHSWNYLDLASYGAHFQKDYL